MFYLQVVGTSWDEGQHNRSLDPLSGCDPVTLD